MKTLQILSFLLLFLVPLAVYAQQTPSERSRPMTVEEMTRINTEAREGGYLKREEEQRKIKGAREEEQRRLHEAWVRDAPRREEEQRKQQEAWAQAQRKQQEAWAQAQREQQEAWNKEVDKWRNTPEITRQSTRDRLSSQKRELDQLISDGNRLYAILNYLYSQLSEDKAQLDELAKLNEQLKKVKSLTGSTVPDIDAELTAIDTLKKIDKQELDQMWQQFNEAVSNIQQAYSAYSSKQQWIDALDTAISGPAPPKR